MNRRALLVISLAALFGLGLPLCAFACQNDGSAARIASSEHPSEEAAACHGGAPNSPEEAPGDTGCDCDGFQALLSKAESSEIHRFVDAADVASAAASLLVPASEIACTRSWRGQQDLPPPDVLLLKSTLIL